MCWLRSMFRAMPVHGVLATHHYCHQIAAGNHWMSVTTLRLKSSMAFFQILARFLSSNLST
uniref:Uncharacterized protein n=1 Tax=Arundo donax TaxID=35708 RepID=A0A0A8Y544_ARUDO